MRIRMKYNIMVTINLFLVLLFLVGIVWLVKDNQKKDK